MRRPRRSVTKHGIVTDHRSRIKTRTGASPLLVDALVYSAGRHTWTA